MVVARSPGGNTPRTARVVTPPQAVAILIAFRIVGVERVPRRHALDPRRRARPRAVTWGATARSPVRSAAASALHLHRKDGGRRVIAGDSADG